MLPIESVKSAQKVCHIDYEKCHIDVQKCHIDVQNGHFEPVFYSVFSTLTYNNITSNIEQVIFNTPRPRHFLRNVVKKNSYRNFPLKGLEETPKFSPKILKDYNILEEFLSAVTLLPNY